MENVYIRGERTLVEAGSFCTKGRWEMDFAITQPLLQGVVHGRERGLTLKTTETDAKGGDFLGW